MAGEAVSQGPPEVHAPPHGTSRRGRRGSLRVPPGRGHAAGGQRLGACGRVERGRYLRPPQDTAEPPFVIEAGLPTREEVLKVGEEAHAGGELWAGTVGVWLARYYPRLDEVICDPPP